MCAGGGGTLLGLSGSVKALPQQVFKRAVNLMSLCSPRTAANEIVQGITLGRMIGEKISGHMLVFVNVAHKGVPTILSFLSVCS